MAAIPEGADKDTRKEIGYPPSEEIMSFYVSPTVQPDMFEFSMYEAAEYYLGSNIFFSLPDRFSKIKGIDSVEQEDRELYIIKSNKLSPAQLKKALWDVFLDASAESFGK